MKGLLINARMVRGIFDDLNNKNTVEFANPDTKIWDAVRNNKEFVATTLEWYKVGFNSFTNNMQSGSLYGYGNKKCLNPGFNPDGSLMQPYMHRLDITLKKADVLRMVLVLGLFYFGQDQHPNDDTAINNATDNMVKRLFEKGYKNVIIEIANEVDLGKQYKNSKLSPECVQEMINRVKNNKQKDCSYPASNSFK